MMKFTADRPYSEPNKQPGGLWSTRKRSNRSRTAESTSRS
jgi:hypothetical protein